MIKTTIYLEAPMYQRLKQIALARGATPAALIREAIASYTRAQPSPKRPRSLGAFRSGRRDLGEHAEEALTGFGEL